MAAHREYQKSRVRLELRSLFFCLCLPEQKEQRLCPIGTTRRVYWTFSTTESSLPPDLHNNSSLHTVKAFFVTNRFMTIPNFAAFYLPKGRPGATSLPNDLMDFSPMLHYPRYRYLHLHHHCLHHQTGQSHCPEQQKALYLDHLQLAAKNYANQHIYKCFVKVIKGRRMWKKITKNILGEYNPKY